MRVLIIHNRYQQAGGEDGVVQAESGLLQVHGHAVQLYLEDNHRIGSMSHASVAARTLWSIETTSKINDVVRRFRPDIAHIHNTFPLISPSVYYALAKLDIPVVQTLHNYRLLCPSATFFREGRVCEECMGKMFPYPGAIHSCYRGNRSASTVTASMLFLHRLMRTWNLKIDSYIALTEFARNKFVEGGVPADKITIKPVFVPDHGMEPSNDHYALFVGRLTEEKGVRVLLEAWKHLSNKIPLKVIGGGHLENEVRAFAESEEGVTYLGRASNEVLRETLLKAAFVVFPSIWYEGMPAVILEAYAAGLPVISSRLGSMQTMVRDSETGYLFDPGNVVSLIQAVEKLLKNPAAYEAMRYACRREYEQLYTPEKNYELLISVYSSVIK